MMLFVDFDMKAVAPPCLEKKTYLGPSTWKWWNILIIPTSYIYIKN